MKTLKSSFFLLVLLFSQAQLNAQTITWVDTTSSYTLPEGVRLFVGKRTSPALKVWYLEVDLSRQELALVPFLSNKTTQTITSFSTEKNAFAAINSGFFSTTNGASFSTVINPGEVLSKNISALTRNGKSYPVMRSMFHIKENREMSVDWIYHYGESVQDVYKFAQPLAYTQSSDPLPAPVSSAGVKFPDPYLGMGGGPVLVKNNEIQVTFDQEIFWGSGVELNQAQPRTAVGYTADKKVIMLVADGRQALSQGFTLTELAQVMKNLGCVEAMNLDGGGSSQITVNKVLLNNPDGSGFQRPIPTILAVVPKDSIPGYEPPAEFEQNIDTGEADRVSRRGGWFESANDGFFGGTKSLIVLSGDGSATVTFKPSLPNEDQYEVYGWWVAAPNRAKNAPFVIHHKAGVDTVRRNQSTSHAQWVKIGTYTFTGTNADSVIVSNKANEVNAYVVADGIRFVKVKSTSVDDSFETIVLPNKIKVEGNFPNPFNPSTTLKYQTELSGTVSIRVINALGQTITQTAPSFRQSGTHEFNWNAIGLSSGMYMYRIELATNSGVFVANGKMTLIK